MVRKTFIELIRRQIYNGQPSDDATITVGLVNTWLEPAIAFAAEKNYKDNAAIDGIAYINNSFYTTFKNIAVTNDGQFVYKVELPQIPIGIGYDEGISILTLKDSSTPQQSQNVVWLTQNQRSYSQGMRPIPNKVQAYSEGKYVYLISTLLLNMYTATVTMVSGGNPSDYESEINVPANYHPLIIEYIQKQLLLEKAQPLDNTSDGEDFTRTT